MENLNSMKLFSFLLLLFVFQSCSLAPFTPGTSGTSNGAGVSRASFGSSNTNFFLKFDHGVSSNFDIGYIMEFGNLATSGITAHYSVANNKTGFALALEGGYGSSATSHYSYLGMINSLGFNENLEIFLGIRAVSAQTAKEDIDLGKTVGAAKVTDYDANYFYNTFGLTIMTSESIGINVYGIYIIGHGVQSPNGMGSGFGLIYKL